MILSSDETALYKTKFMDCITGKLDLYKFFSMSPYKKLPENAVVISLSTCAAPNAFPVDYWYNLSVFHYSSLKKKVMDYIALSF